MPGELRRRELVDGVFIVTHTIDDSHDGWRADNYLRAQYKHFSRNKLQGLIDEGRVNMLGKRLKASTTLRPGDEIRVLTAQTAEPEVDMHYKVLYEDDDVLVIDKPGNLPVHPAGKFLFNTLLMALRAERSQNFHLIHRLDRETSGVILLAKNPVSAGYLTVEFRERRTEKRYSALVVGHPPQDEFSIDADIGSALDSSIRLKMQAYPKGTSEMEALTHFKVLARGKNFSLVDCQLMTGRQHQIRVHLTYAGYPIVGDKLYGGDENTFLDFINNRSLGRAQKFEVERQALHSRYLRFYHAGRKEWLEIESPIPPDMQRLLNL